MRKILFFKLLLLLFEYSHQVVEIKIGAICGKDNDDIFGLLRSAVNGQNKYQKYVKFSVSIVNISFSDSYEAQLAACSLAKEGVSVIFGPNHQTASAIVSSISKKLGIPHLIAHEMSFTEDAIDDNHNFTRNLFPQSNLWAQALFDVTTEFTWTTFSIIYENDQSLMRLYDILQHHEMMRSVRIYRLPNYTKDYRSFWKLISKSGVNRFVVDCSKEKWIEIIEQGKAFNMTREYITYFLTGLDMYTMNSSIFNEIDANITTIRFIDPSNLDMMNVVQVTDVNRVATEVALINDMTVLFAKSFNDNETFAKSLLPLLQLECDGTKRWPFGEQILQNIDQTYMLNGMTHPIHFDENGQRDEFRLEILELSKDKTFEKIATWDVRNKVNVTRTQVDLEKEIIESTQNKVFEVVSRLQMPFLRRIKDNSTVPMNGNDMYEGFAKDLAEAISRKLNTTFRIRVVSLLGKKDKENRWDGIIGELVNRQADMAICDLTITHSRRSVIDFTSAFMVLGIDLLMARTQAKERDLFSFMEPFALDVWMYTATAFLCISIVLVILARMAAGDWENPHPCEEDAEELENIWNMHNCIWLAVGSIMQQGCDILPKAVPTRLVAGIWWFFALIVTSSYIANLAAFLTKDMQPSEIKSVEDLSKQSRVKYGLMTGGSTEIFFRDSEFPLYRRMYEIMDSDPSVLFDNTTDGIQHVLDADGKYSFFMESSMIDYYTQTMCNLAKLDQRLDSKGYGIGLPKDSKYRILIGKALLSLKEETIVKQLIEKWWITNNEGNCESGQHINTATPELGMDNVGGVFVVLAAGVACAILLGLFEFIWSIRQTSIEEKITPCEAFKKELYFACSFWITRKPIKLSRESRSERDEDSLTSSGNDEIQMNRIDCA